MIVSTTETASVLQEGTNIINTEMGLDIGPSITKSKMMKAMHRLWSMARLLAQMDY